MADQYDPKHTSTNNTLGPSIEPNKDQTPLPYSIVIVALKNNKIQNTAGINNFKIQAL